jgi:hypothetical protein
MARKLHTIIRGRLGPSLKSFRVFGLRGPLDVLAISVRCTWSVLYSPRGYQQSSPATGSFRPSDVAFCERPGSRHAWFLRQNQRTRGSCADGARIAHHSDEIVDLLLRPPRNMSTPILAPTAAAPLLWLGLQKISRTPRPRLAVGYRLVCRRGSRRGCGCGTAAAADPSKLPPGARLRLERFLAGGVAGETLPLSLFNCRPGELGAQINLLA